MKETEQDILNFLLMNDCTNKEKSKSIRKISDQLSISQSSVRKSILTFENEGYVQKGRMDYNAKTYFITQKGIDVLMK